MEELLKRMKERTAILKKAISKAKQDNRRFPEGSLRISFSNNRPRYYHITPNGDPYGEYVKKEKRGLVEKLAQKDYKEKFLRDATKELALLEHTIKLLSKSNADLVFRNLSIHRQKLVMPYLKTDEMFVEEWLEEGKNSGDFMTETLVYDTKKGDKVRSKSESIIADILYDLGIPYLYEKRLDLRDGISKYPDFTLLDVKRRKEIYLEHFGMLDQPDYLARNLQKLDEYRANGIYPGNGLLFTYEMEGTPLDIKGIRKMLDELFCQ